MPKPKTRAGSGLTIRKNSDEVLAENVQDLDVVEGAGIQLTLAFDRAEAAAKLTIVSTGGGPLDKHVEISPSDTNPSGLDAKLVVTAPITKVVENVGGNELLRVAHGGQHAFSDVLGTISAAQHGTIVSGNLHPEYATDVDLAGYALLAGRNPAQVLSGGTLTGQQFVLKANAVDATGVLTLDPTTSTLAGNLTLTGISGGPLFTRTLRIGSGVSGAGTLVLHVVDGVKAKIMGPDGITFIALNQIITLTTPVIELFSSAGVYISGPTLFLGNNGVASAAIAADIYDGRSFSRMSWGIPGASFTGPTIFNDGLRDMDFQVKGDTDGNLIYVDASTDRVGIGTAVPGYKVEVAGTLGVTGETTITVSTQGATLLTMTASGAAQAQSRGLYTDMSPNLGAATDMTIRGFQGVIQPTLSGAATHTSAEVMVFTVVPLVTADGVIVGTITGAAITVGFTDSSPSGNAGVGVIVGLSITPSIAAGAATTVTTSYGVSVGDVGNAVVSEAYGFSMAMPSAATTVAYGLYIQGGSTAPTARGILQDTTTVPNVLAGRTTVGSNVAPLGVLDCVGGTFAPAVNALGRIARVSGTLTEFTSGTHARMMGLEITAPVITAGVAATTVGVSLYISAAPTGGTTNYALWVDAGAVRLDGNIGFFATAPVAQASAYTQTYATADKTHANPTSADIGAFTGGIIGFLDAAERDNVRTQVNALRADVLDVKQLVNSVIDDLQAYGLAA